MGVAKETDRPRLGAQENGALSDMVFALGAATAA